MFVFRDQGAIRIEDTQALVNKSICEREVCRLATNLQKAWRCTLQASPFMGPPL